MHVGGEACQQSMTGFSNRKKELVLRGQSLKSER